MTQLMLWMDGLEENFKQARFCGETQRASSDQGRLRE